MIIVLLFWATREGFITHGAEATVLIFCGGHASQKALVGIYMCMNTQLTALYAHVRNL